MTGEDVYSIQWWNINALKYSCRVAEYCESIYYKYICII